MRQTSFCYTKGTGNGSAITHVFWSGGNAAKDAAQKWAASNNGITLEMTSVGKKLEQVTKDMKWTDAKPLWDAASANFAKEASGVVHVFHNVEGVSLTSVWRTVEYPILNESKAITQIIYHAAYPGR